MIEELKKKTRELLRTKQVDVIIGYKRAADGVMAIPCFVDNEDDVDRLIWDAYCVYNLSNYLNPVRNTKVLEKENKISNGVKDFAGKKVAIVAKACDVKSIIVLLQENQLKRENVFIIGVECKGVIDERKMPSSVEQTQEIGFEKKCKSCNSSIPLIYDVLLEEKERKEKISEVEDGYEPIRKLEAKSLEERLKFWQEEFSRCIRCYACRQICPMCYCPKCVADQMQPFWFSKATSLEGSFSWNVTRAMHLAGRCIDCGECERACPVGIPLRQINKKIEKDVKELFNYEAGLSSEGKPLLSCFDKSDPEDFIK